MTEITKNLALIALVGRTNVGKSTIFNRLSRSRAALVANEAGLTRDRQYAKIILADRACEIVDSGGLTFDDSDLDSGIEQQVWASIEHAEVIYFVLSAIDGVTALDLKIAAKLRKLKQPIILVCNKSEGQKNDINADFFALGMGQPLAISAEHNQGIDDLAKATIALLPSKNSAAEKQFDTGIIVAILGRPNVGKSTLINRILGEQRVLAIDLPGTTRDSVSIPFERSGQKYTLIDTAGIRRKQKTHNKIEKFSILKALEASAKSQVVVLVLDAQTGVTEQDATLLGMIAEQGRAVVIVVNKWDGLDDYQKQEVQRKLELKLAFINYASIHYISALHGSGVGKLFTPIQRSYQNAAATFPTSLLNKVLQKANKNHQAPAAKGKRIKIKFINQIGTFPPTFALHGNSLNNTPKTFERYLKNFFIKSLKLTNTPIKFEYKITENPFHHKK